MSTGISRTTLIVTVIASATVSLGAGYWLANDDDYLDKIRSLEDTIASLRKSLLEKDAELSRIKNSMNERPALSHEVTTTSAQESVNLPNHDLAAQVNVYQSTPEAKPTSLAILKNLETVSDNDPRTLGKKIHDLMSTGADKTKVAIASHAVFDMAKNREQLPDYMLQSLYSSQSDPDFKRTIAQVLAQRGNQTLLESQIAETQARLKSDRPQERQEALNQLGKLRSAKAADVIAPYLLDADINVKLDALQALRDTGNQTHASFVGMLVNDPDPAVSTLANEVLSQLKSLSSSARITPISAEIETTLPLMPN